MFEKTIVTPKGAITNFHLVCEIRAKFPQDTQLSVIVASYTSEGDYLQNSQPVKKTEVFVPLTAIGSNFIKSLEQWIVSDLSSSNIFANGDIKAKYSDDPLIYAQDKQWAIIKTARATELNAVDYDKSNNEVKDAVTAIKDKASSLKNAIYSATDIPTVEAIVWDTTIPLINP